MMMVWEDVPEKTLYLLGNGGGGASGLAKLILTLLKRKKGVQIVWHRVVDVQKIDFATLRGKNKNAVGMRGNFCNAQRRRFFFCDVFPEDLH